MGQLAQNFDILYMLILPVLARLPAAAHDPLERGETHRQHLNQTRRLRPPFLKEP